MAKEWTDEEVSKEIADAVAIVREDRFEAFVRGLQSPSNSNQNGGDDKPGDSGNGGGNDPTAPKKRKAIFWGEQE